MGKTAIIVVDMLNDTLNVDSPACMVEGRKIIPNIQRLLAHARKHQMPIIFANDAFLPEDFMFRETGRKPHSIMGTKGAEVIAELRPQEGDIVLPKRRMSAFFDTGLEITLRQMEIDTIAVTGITTSMCVLNSVMDGLAHDFYAILLEDCCAAYQPRDHQAIVDVYRSKGMQPLLRVMPLETFLTSLTRTEK